MDIQFYIPRWGNRDLSWAEFTLKAKQDGYAGVEAGLPIEKEEQVIMFEQFALQGLNWIGQHFETSTADFEAHLIEFEERLSALAAAKPMFINSQTGKDFFTFEQNCKLIDCADRVSKKTGVTIVHETHRGKFSFCASNTANYLHHYPNLKITADFSHWCCVSESFLENQQAAVDLAINRAVHIHSRVGFTGGPQIGHPAAPEWKDALDFHCQWWDAIVHRHLALKSNTLTITCEFGPYPYMPQLPFSQQNVSDLWEVNLFMKDYLQNRYAHLIRTISG